jgi:hypothetical protein
LAVSEQSGPLAPIEWVTVALEEYKTLRAESLAAIEQMQRTMQIALVAIGVVTGFGVDAADGGPGVQAGLVMTTPAFAALMLVMWLDELRRSVSAGAHVAKVEHRIARLYENQEPPLTWETEIQATYEPHGYRYVRQWSTAGTLFAATTPVITIGLVRLGREGEWELFALAAAVVVLIIGLTVAYQAGVHNKMFTLQLETRGAIGLDRDDQPAAEPRARLGRFLKRIGG